MADVKRLLGRYNIEFVEQGPNVAKGNVNIHCPWCGAEDHSHHLGINLATGMWGCWRSQKHRGRMLSYLLQKLTGLTPSEARSACGEGDSIAVQPDDFDNALSSLTEDDNSVERERTPRNCSFDPYMHKLTGRTRSQRRAVQYLTADRGFHPNEVRRLARRYDLHFAITGDYADRIVVPVYEEGVLQTYLGRSIHADAALRYRALEKEQSIKQVKDCLYNFDNANKPGDKLFITEGAIDAWKMDFYNYKSGIRAVGLFNMNLEDAQLELMHQLRFHYKEAIILLDAGQVGEALYLQGMLAAFFDTLRVHHLDEAMAKDPGELTKKQAIRLAKEA